MFDKVLNLIDNFYNYFFFTKPNLHTKSYSPQQTNLMIPMQARDSEVQKYVADNIYRQCPPGFQNANADTKKTANAVLNSNMANADTGATGS